MFEPVKVFKSRAPVDPNTAGMVLLFEVPHGKNLVPLGLPFKIDPVRLETHEGYDPGVAAIANTIAKTLARGPYETVMAVSGISRLVADHNRTSGFCNTEIPADVMAPVIKAWHKPYADAVYGEIQKIIDQGKFPIRFDVHTYNPVNPPNPDAPEQDGKPRRGFSISGNADSVIIQATNEHLHSLLGVPSIKQELEKLGLEKRDFIAPLNDPFDLGHTLSRDLKLDGQIYKEGDRNPVVERNMAMRYALMTDHPWMHLEVRNDIAAEPVTQRIISRLYGNIVMDPKVVRDFETRKQRYFDPPIERRSPSARPDNTEEFGYC